MAIDDDYSWCAYELIAEHYDAARVGWTLHFEMSWFKKHSSTMGPIVDAGCGPGRDLSFLSDISETVIGIDASSAMLDIAKNQVIKSAGTTLIRANICDIPLSDNTCGGIWCSTVLPHLRLKDLEKALNEFCRILIPGSLLVATFKVGHGEGLESATDLQNASRWIRYTQESEISSLLIGAGFKVVEWYEWNESVRFIKNGRNMNFVSVAAVAR